jgi:hypothetical protein
VLAVRDAAAKLGFACECAVVGGCTCLRVCEFVVEVIAYSPQHYHCTLLLSTRSDTRATQHAQMMQAMTVPMMTTMRATARLRTRT